MKAMRKKNWWASIQDILYLVMDHETDNNITIYKHILKDIYNIKIF